MGQRFYPSRAADGSRPGSSPAPTGELDALSREGLAPRPIHIGRGNGSVRFDEAEIDAWLASKVAERDVVSAT